jgi:hypothetical protein
MKPIFPFFIITGIIALFLTSCNKDEFGPRKESTPVFESASVSPASFTFGDSVTLTATITDPATNLSALSYEVVSEGRVITSGEIQLAGDTTEIANEIFIPLLNNQEDNSEVRIHLIARNVLKGTASREITGLTGKRPVYNQLYLVTDNGAVVVLNPQPADQNKFEGTDLTLDTSFRFKLVERLHADNSIDYSGDVYGNVNGRIGMIDESGESAFAYMPDADYTKVFAYDNFTFNVSAAGGELGADDLALSAFGSQDIDNESFRTLTRILENGKTYTVFGALGDVKNIYNPDFFERVSTDRVRFLGKTGEYTLYFNPVRKNIVVGLENPSYPDYLLITGWGAGYPTHVTTEEIASVYPGHRRIHTNWGFDHVMNYILLRQISTGVYQGTFFTPGEHDHYAGFKPFENTGWGNEKRADQFTFTGEQIISGDNDWTIANGENDPVVESANYRFTINLNDNTVHIEKITL